MNDVHLCLYLNKFIFFAHTNKKLIITRYYNTPVTQFYIYIYVCVCVFIAHIHKLIQTPTPTDTPTHLHTYTHTHAHTFEHDNLIIL